MSANEMVNRIAELEERLARLAEIVNNEDYMGKAAERDYDDACESINTLNRTIRNILMAITYNSLKGIRDIVVDVEDDIDDETFTLLDKIQSVSGGPDVE